MASANVLTLTESNFEAEVVHSGVPVLVDFWARWCGPCRRFSPELVQAYQKLKKIAPERFELVFISSDNDDDEQVRYVREVGMPWPVLKYSSVGRVEPLEKWKGNGIPCLVAVTREGDVLYHSYRGTEYLGPSVVLRHVEEMLGAAAGGDDATKRGTHRLEVLQHVRKAAGATAMAKPHLIVFDPRRYRTLTEKLIHATLAIDARGRVTAASFDAVVSAGATVVSAAAVVSVKPEEPPHAVSESAARTERAMDVCFFMVLSFRIRTRGRERSGAVRRGFPRPWPCPRTCPLGRR
jgi:thiol-disulfide isomerase/thioredoxin